MRTLTPVESDTPDVQLWDVVAAAAATGLTVRYIRLLVAERRLPIVKIGRLVRIRPADLQAYIEASTIPAQQWAR